MDNLGEIVDVFGVTKAKAQRQPKNNASGIAAVESLDGRVLMNAVLNTFDASSFVWQDYFDMPTDLGASNYMTGGCLVNGSNSQYLIASNDGLIAKMLGKTEQGAPVNSGISGMRGLAPTLTGYITTTNDAGHSLVFLDANTYTQRGVFITLPASVTNVKGVATAFYLNSSANVPGLGYAIFVLDNNGVERVTGISGNTASLYNVASVNPNNWMELNMTEFKHGSYDSPNDPMIEIGGQFFYNLTLDGNTIIGSKNLNSVVDLQSFTSTIYTNTGMIGIESDSGQMYSSMPYQSNIETAPIPEPTTLVLTLIGAVGLAKRVRGRVRESFNSGNK